VSGTVLTYDPKKFSLAIGGYIMGGFADDDYVTVERDEDAYKKYVGVSGEVARVKNLNRAGHIVLRLMQSSDSNDALSLLAVLDEAADLGAVPVLARDHSGRSLFAAAFCWVKKFPKAVWKKDVALWEWSLDTTSLTVYTGGNTQ
jgi:hypothetical protein